MVGRRYLLLSKSVVVFGPCRKVKGTYRLMDSILDQTHLPDAGDAPQDSSIALAELILPPQRRYVATVHIVARRRPDILIAPEDFDTSLSDSEWYE